MNSKKIIIIGGLGNGSVIAAAIQDANLRGNNEWEFHGYLNDREQVGSLIDGMPVMGSLRDSIKFVKEGYYFINTIFRIDGQQERIDLFEKLHIPEDRLAIFIHPTAYVAPNVVLGPGSVIMPNASLSPGTVFGKGALVMVNAIIGHNNIIGDYCHFAAQCCVGAYLKIGDGVHIGLNASIKENLVIGKNATLGMGAVLTKDISDNEIWVGNPAKFLRMAE
jgi:acetyltransferase EpsM